MWITTQIWHHRFWHTPICVHLVADFYTPTLLAKTPRRSPSCCWVEVTSRNVAHGIDPGRCSNRFKVPACILYRQRIYRQSYINNLYRHLHTCLYNEYVNFVYILWTTWSLFRIFSFMLVWSDLCVADPFPITQRRQHMATVLHVAGLEPNANGHLVVRSVVWWLVKSSYMLWGMW